MHTHASAGRTVDQCLAALLRPQHRQRLRPFVSVSSSPRKRQLHVVKASTAQQAPASAKVAVEQGLKAFANGDTSAALSLFQKSMSMNPSQDEARAAMYNSACCLVKEKQWQAAADAVAEACNKHGLKYSIALKVF